MQEAPTLVAEKPTYSRGADGRTPFGVPSFQEKIVDLQQETLQRSGRQEYMTADTSFNQTGAVKVQEQSFRVATELGRQREEKANLEKAFKIEKSQLFAKWAKKIEEVEEDCRVRQAILMEKQEIARVDREKEVVEHVSKIRFKKSSTLLQLEDTEKKLAKQHDFKQATEVMSRAERQRKLEEAEYRRRIEVAQRKPLEELAARQDAEMRIFTQKCHGMRLAIQRERDAAFAVYKQKYCNLEADQSHAHAIEYTMHAEIGAVQSHKSRSTTASTFRGTLKYESLAGTKFDVSDVSTLADGPDSTPVARVNGDAY